jgi:hypothetical protein
VEAKAAAVGEKMTCALLRQGFLTLRKEIVPTNLDPIAANLVLNIETEIPGRKIVLFLPKRDLWHMDLSILP